MHARRARRHRAERFVAAIGEERRRGENVHPGRPRARRFPRLRARPRASRRVRRRVRGDGSSPRRRDALRRFTPMRRRGIRAAHSRASLLLRERETRGDAVRGGGRVARRAPTAHALEGRDWVLVRRRTRPRRARDDVDVYGERVGAKIEDGPRGFSSRPSSRDCSSRPRPGPREDIRGSDAARRPSLAPPTRFALSRVWRRGDGRVPRDGIFPGRGRDARRVSHRGVRVVRGRAGVHVRAARVVADVRAVDLRRRGRVSLRRARVAVGGGARAGDDWARREDARAGVLGASAGMSLRWRSPSKSKRTGFEGIGGMEGFEGFDTASAAARLSNPALRRSRRFGRRPAHLVGSASELARRALVNARAGWMPAVGNVATSVAFVASIATAIRIRPESNLHALALAPILLLLHEDGVVFESLAGRKKYARPWSPRRSSSSSPPPRTSREARRRPRWRPGRRRARWG